MTRPKLEAPDTHPPLAHGVVQGVEEEAGAADEGPPPSFQALYDEHFSFTWRALRHLGVPQEALEDAAQEVWLVVHRRLGSFEGRSGARTWLFGIAMNVARNRRRGARRAPELYPLPEQLVSTRPDPEGVHAGQEAWRKLQCFLDGLDELRRAVFVSSLLEQLPAAETAEATGLDVASVYQHVRRLRHAFRLFLAEQESGAP